MVNSPPMPAATMGKATELAERPTSATSTTSIVYAPREPAAQGPRYRDKAASAAKWARVAELRTEQIRLARAHVRLRAATKICASTERATTLTRDPMSTDTRSRQPPGRGVVMTCL